MRTVIEFATASPHAPTSNKRLNRYALANMTRAIRQTARTQVLAKGPTARKLWPLGPVDVYAELGFPDKRQRDAPNYWPLVKPAIDGAVDAGLLAGDHQGCVRQTIFDTYDRRERGLIWLRLTFEEIS